MYGSEFREDRFREKVAQLCNNKAVARAIKEEHGGAVLEAVRKGLMLDADTMEGVAETALATFHDEARDLLVLAWDSGSSHLCELEGVIIFRSSDYSPNGPFDSLDEALVACETFSTVTADAELDSDTVPLEKLLRIGHDIVPWDENGTIRINGQQYVADNGVLRPVEED